MFKTFFKESYKMIIFFIIFFLIITYPVPYYVFTSGGITDLSDRFEINEGYEQKGSYNLSYVNQVEGNVLTYLASFIIPNWEKIEIEKYQYNDNESLEEMALRDRIALTYANQIAVMFAYSKANKEVKINDSYRYVYATYEFMDSDTKIKIGDILLKADGEEINNLYRVKEIIQEKEINDYVELEFDRNGETYTAKIKVQDVSGVKAIGIKFYTIYDYEVDPEIRFKFKDSESGASAGLMTTLAIYDTLIPEDLTNGLKIAGTGTIEEDGSIGEIGGVKYKLAGAVSDDADIFFAPTGENYEEAMELKKKRNYNIKIIEVKTLDDAINYLKSLKNN